MTAFYIFLILLQAGVIVYFVRRGKKLSAEPAVPSKFDALRNTALTVTPYQLKLAIPNAETLVYGVVMDWDLGDAMVTLSAYITGAANMYYTSGDSKTGAGKHPNVGEAAVELVTTAQKFLNKALPADISESPAKGFISFYFLTNHRVFMAREAITNFETNASEWLPLFQKATEVMNEMKASGNGHV
jgi:hypothetical protein